MKTRPSPNLNGFKNQLTAAANIVEVFRNETQLRGTGPTIPSNGPVFFSSTGVPIESAKLGPSLKLAYDSGTCSGLSDSQIPSYLLGFMTPDRANYVLWRYNSWVQVCTDSPLSGGGGNRLTQGLLNKFHDVLGN